VWATAAGILVNTGNKPITKAAVIIDLEGLTLIDKQYQLLFQKIADANRLQ
jgi:hypothetical protein